jgi:hypothetical protein
VQLGVPCGGGGFEVVELLMLLLLLLLLDGGVGLYGPSGTQMGVPVQISLQLRKELAARMVPDWRLNWFSREAHESLGLEMYVDLHVGVGGGGGGGVVLGDHEPPQYHELSRVPYSPTTSYAGRPVHSATVRSGKPWLASASTVPSLSAALADHWNVSCESVRCGLVFGSLYARL